MGSPDDNKATVSAFLTALIQHNDERLDSLICNFLDVF